MSRRVASGKRQSSGQRLKEVLAVGQVLRVQTQQHDKLLFYDAEDVRGPARSKSPPEMIEMNRMNERLSVVIDETATMFFFPVMTMYKDNQDEWNCPKDFSLLMMLSSELRPDVLSSPEKYKRLSGADWSTSESESWCDLVDKHNKLLSVFRFLATFLERATEMFYVSKANLDAWGVTNEFRELMSNQSMRVLHVKKVEDELASFYATYQTELSKSDFWEHTHVLPNGLLQDDGTCAQNDDRTGPPPLRRIPCVRP